MWEIIWVTEDVKIGFPSPGDTGRQDHPCSVNVAVEIAPIGNSSNRASLHRVVVTKSFVFVGKLLRDVCKYSVTIANGSPCMIALSQRAITSANGNP